MQAVDRIVHRLLRTGHELLFSCGNKLLILSSAADAVHLQAAYQ